MRVPEPAVLMSRPVGLAVALCVAALGLAGAGISVSSIVTAQTRRVDDAALRDAGRTAEEWLTYGLTLGETRYSPAAQIDATNVARLRLAWSYDVGPGGGNQEATPLVWDGTIYGITNWSVVFAVDARTGKEKWRWDPEVNQAAVRSKTCCGIVSRGLALYQGKIIAPILDGRLQALDAKTGKIAWEARVAHHQENYTITMAPRIAKGKVIIGVAGGEFPTRGFFDAYDANTGRFAWRFYTVPGDPAKGFESPAMKKAAATWDGEWWKFGGGGSVWDGIAYDPESELVYVGTGNGGPWPEALRQSQGKDNLYVCSIVAVDVDTGELKWHFQNTPGDSWDYDSVQGFVLADLAIKGRQRKVLMQANKNGFYYVLDRVTGAFISAEPFAEISWATGINPETGRPAINPDAQYTVNGKATSVMPANGGAHNWAPMSFNPKTGLVYVPATLGSRRTFVVDPGYQYQVGRMNTGVPRGGRGGASTENPRIPASIGPKLPPGQPGGALLAWDPVAQQERWRAPVGGGSGGGTLTTAGNLVFQVINDGRLFAYTADRGEKVLEMATGVRGGMGPPITYMLDGKQYVAVMGGVSGGGGGGGAAAQNAPPTPALQPKLLTFVLDGTSPQR
jgi:quinohemoprotein ethanol dehydrogenase